nr:MAG TPA: hypothetical protein [Caudoviricetes sp.]
MDSKYLTKTQDKKSYAHINTRVTHSISTFMKLCITGIKFVKTFFQKCLLIQIL